MIITRLTWGLGDNFFQYALGRRLALERGTGLLLDISRENYRRQQYMRSYMSNFNMIKSTAKPWDVMKVKLLNRFYFLNFAYKNSVIKESKNSFDSTILSAPKNAYLIGHWQSEKYFKPIENIIRQDFKFKEPQNEKYRFLLDKINRSNSVSVHIRRGNYLSERNLRLFSMCTPDYFLGAEAFISKKIPSIELFVFSNDIEWVKQNIPFHFPATFVSDGSLTDYQELMLMSACKHNITANSSFSWWGAWLNSNPQKIVVTPQKWFVDPAMEEKDVVPSTWVKMSNTQTVL